MKLMDADNFKARLNNMQYVYLQACYEDLIDAIDCEVTYYKEEHPQDEYVDISKLRLMTVEECAGHTIDYAMGWKACIEWIKKGGAE